METLTEHPLSPGRKVNRHDVELEARIRQEKEEVDTSTAAARSDEQKHQRAHHNQMYKRIKGEAEMAQTLRRLENERRGFLIADTESIAMDRAACRGHIDYLEDCVAKSLAERAIMLQKMTKMDSQQATMLMKCEEDVGKKFQQLLTEEHRKHELHSQALTVEFQRRLEVVESAYQLTVEQLRGTRTQLATLSKESEEANTQLRKEKEESNRQLRHELSAVIQERDAYFGQLGEQREALVEMEQAMVDVQDAQKEKTSKLKKKLAEGEDDKTLLFAEIDKLQRQCKIARYQLSVAVAKQKTLAHPQIDDIANRTDEERADEESQAPCDALSTALSELTFHDSQIDNNHNNVNDAVTSEVVLPISFVGPVETLSKSGRKTRKRGDQGMNAVIEWSVGDVMKFFELFKCNDMVLQKVYDNEVNGEVMDSMTAARFTRLTGITFPSHIQTIIRSWQKLRSERVQPQALSRSNGEEGLIEALNRRIAEREHELERQLTAYEAMQNDIDNANEENQHNALNVLELVSTVETLQHSVENLNKELEDASHDLADAIAEIHEKDEYINEVEIEVSKRMHQEAMREAQREIESLEMVKRQRLETEEKKAAEDAEKKKLQEEFEARIKEATELKMVTQRHTTRTTVAATQLQRVFRGRRGRNHAMKLKISHQALKSRQNITSAQRDILKTAIKMAVTTSSLTAPMDVDGNNDSGNDDDNKSESENEIDYYEHLLEMDLATQTAHLQKALLLCEVQHRQYLQDFEMKQLSNDNKHHQELLNKNTAIATIQNKCDRAAAEIVTLKLLSKESGQEASMLYEAKKELMNTEQKLATATRALQSALEVQRQQAVDMDNMQEQYKAALDQDQVEHRMALTELKNSRMAEPEREPEIDHAHIHAHDTAEIKVLQEKVHLLEESIVITTDKHESDIATIKASENKCELLQRELSASLSRAQTTVDELEKEKAAHGGTRTELAMLRGSVRGTSEKKDAGDNVRNQQHKHVHGSEKDEFSCERDDGEAEEVEEEMDEKQEEKDNYSTNFEEEEEEEGGEGEEGEDEGEEENNQGKNNIRRRNSWTSHRNSVILEENDDVDKRPASAAAGLLSQDMGGDDGDDALQGETLDTAWPEEGVPSAYITGTQMNNITCASPNHVADLSALSYEHDNMVVYDSEAVGAVIGIPDTSIDNNGDADISWHGPNDYGTPPYNGRCKQANSYRDNEYEMYQQLQQYQAQLATITDDLHRMTEDRNALLIRCNRYRRVIESLSGAHAKMLQQVEISNRPKWTKTRKAPKVSSETNGGVVVSPRPPFIVSKIEPPAKFTKQSDKDKSAREISEPKCSASVGNMQPPDTQPVGPMRPVSEEDYGSRPSSQRSPSPPKLYIKAHPVKLAKQQTRPSSVDWPSEPSVPSPRLQPSHEHGQYSKPGRVLSTRNQTSSPSPPASATSPTQPRTVSWLKIPGQQQQLGASEEEHQDGSGQAYVCEDQDQGKHQNSVQDENFIRSNGYNESLDRYNGKYNDHQHLTVGFIESINVASLEGSLTNLSPSCPLPGRIIQPKLTISNDGEGIDIMSVFDEEAEVMQMLERLESKNSPAQLKWKQTKPHFGGPFKEHDEIPIRKPVPAQEKALSQEIELELEKHRSSPIEQSNEQQRHRQLQSQSEWRHQQDLQQPLQIQNQQHQQKQSLQPQLKLHLMPQHGRYSNDNRLHSARSASRNERDEHGCELMTSRSDAPQTSHESSLSHHYRVDQNQYRSPVTERYYDHDLEQKQHEQYDQQTDNQMTQEEFLSLQQMDMKRGKDDTVISIPRGGVVPLLCPSSRDGAPPSIIVGGNLSNPKQNSGNPKKKVSRHAKYKHLQPHTRGEHVRQKYSHKPSPGALREVSNWGKNLELNAGIRRNI